MGSWMVWVVGGRLWLAFFKEVSLGGAVVTFLRQGGRGAEADPMVLVLKTIEILQLQFFDEVVPSCPTALRGLVQFLVKVVDVSVVVHAGRASVTCLLGVGAGCCGALLWSRASMTCLLSGKQGVEVFPFTEFIVEVIVVCQRHRSWTFAWGTVL